MHDSEFECRSFPVSHLNPTEEYTYFVEILWRFIVILVGNLPSQISSEEYRFLNFDEVGGV